MVPIAYPVELALAPGETVDFTIPVTEDMILEAIAATAQGPALLRLRVVPPASAGAPTAETPSATFTDYLADELPVYLAAEAGETLETWQATNGQLAEAAQGGDD